MMNQFPALVAYDYFLFICEASFKHSPVMLYLSPTSRILNENSVGICRAVSRVTYDQDRSC